MDANFAFRHIDDPVFRNLELQIQFPFIDQVTVSAGVHDLYDKVYIGRSRMVTGRTRVEKHNVGLRLICPVSAVKPDGPLDAYNEAVLTLAHQQLSQPVDDRGVRLADWCHS